MKDVDDPPSACTGLYCMHCKARHGVPQATLCCTHVRCLEICTLKPYSRNRCRVPLTYVCLCHSSTYRYAFLLTSFHPISFQTRELASLPPLAPPSLARPTVTSASPALVTSWPRTRGGCSPSCRGPQSATSSLRWTRRETAVRGRAG